MSIVYVISARSLSGKGSIPARALYWHFPHYKARTVPNSIIVKGKYKLISYYENKHSPKGGQPDKLYDLEADPGETRNLVSTHKNLAAKLQNELTRHLEETGVQLPVAKQGSGKVNKAGHTKAASSGSRRETAGHGKNTGGGPSVNLARAATVTASSTRQKGTYSKEAVNDGNTDVKNWTHWTCGLDEVPAGTGGAADISKGPWVQLDFPKAVACKPGFPGLGSALGYNRASFDRINKGFPQDQGQQNWRIQWVKAARMPFA